MASVSSAGAGETSVSARSNVQKGALVVGVVFLLVGVLGFIPGITTNYGQLGLIGHESEALLLGLFQVSVFHNIVHFLYGVIGVLFARTSAGSWNYLLWGGVVYAVLFIYGLVVPHDSVANFVPFNGADNILHIGLAIGMIALALLFGGRRERTGAH
ncbi:DUF4383 domain-containing protein [Arthrobacter sp. H5]|uniref:DUF4383 domain-containing protein n=1 Tax=Arthrobacter sp. H5 TaxID=1267973 RepID=UPI00056893A9|nr:DUF4383 domain-containing protein [Arthrobacter sp. H5]